MKQLFTGHTQAKKPDLLNLFSLRGTENSAPYWNTINNLEITSDDLDTILPPHKIPKIVDGQISYSYRSPFVSIDSEPKTYSTMTFSASAAERFLTALQYIKENDPDFISQFAEDSWRGDVMGCILALHMTGEELDTKEIWLKKLRDNDYFLLRCRDYISEILENDFFPFDGKFRTATQSLVEAYVKYKLPKIGQSKWAEDVKINAVLGFAAMFDLNDNTVKFINQNVSFPKSIKEIHREGTEKLTSLLKVDPEWLTYLAAASKNFGNINEAERKELAQNVLNLLSSSYGVYPPPVFEWDDECFGQHGWFSDKKKECFANPLGKVFAGRGAFSSFESMLEILCHEFCHCLEDLSLLSLNPDFQRWMGEEGKKSGVEIGNEEQQKRLKAAGFAFAFNTAAKAPELNGDGLQTPYFRGGSYYQPKRSIDKTDEEKEKRIQEYWCQLRERHAVSMGGHLEREICKVLDLANRYSDPLAAFMFGQFVMYPIEDLLKSFVTNLSVPDEKKDEFLKNCEEVSAHFKEADRRDLSYHNKLRQMEMATQKSALLINTYLPDDDNKAREANKIFELAFDCWEATRMGLCLLKHKSLKCNNDVQLEPQVS